MPGQANDPTQGYSKCATCCGHHFFNIAKGGITGHKQRKNHSIMQNVHYRARTQKKTIIPHIVILKRHVPPSSPRPNGLGLLELHCSPLQHNWLQLEHPQWAKLLSFLPEKLKTAPRFSNL
jgi:hypothetical protein